MRTFLLSLSLFMLLTSAAWAHDPKQKTPTSNRYTLVAVTGSYFPIAIEFATLEQCETAQRGIKRTGHFLGRTFCVRSGEETND